jgi:uncharacterized phage-associated protein
MASITTYQNISDYFLSLANEVQDFVSNMKLQKLVYYAQAWHLGYGLGNLFDDDFQAWIHGPVIPALYDDYKIFGPKPIIKETLTDGSFDRIHKMFPRETQELLTDVIDEYFGMGAFDLENLTHREQPWIKARAGLGEDVPSNNIIQKEWMIEYYSQFVKREQVPQDSQH